MGRVLGQVVWTEWENYRRPLGESDASHVPFPYRCGLHTGGVGWTVVFTLFVPICYFSTRVPSSFGTHLLCDLIKDKIICRRFTTNQFLVYLRL